jgi:hypothetical protein
MNKTNDRATRLHLMDARDQIAKILDPKIERTVGGPPVVPTNAGLDDEDLTEICFPDYAIR